MKGPLLVEEIDALLPQTQCRRCGFSGCQPYAEAIAEGRAEINQCPPGGEEGIRNLAGLLGVSPMPLNTAYGEFKSQAVAVIDEQYCIGCTLCIQACPVDAIVGAARQMHTVIAEECTGCELCVEPCPVDCISMITTKADHDEGTGTCAFTDTFIKQESEEREAEKRKAARRARERHQFRLQRLEREKQEREGRLIKKTEAVASSSCSLAAPDLKKATIQAALERARAQAQAARKKILPKSNISSS